ncbi:hypothetical protein G9C98_005844 [Cotesia typhae]|uniref:E3 ubiquitin-protein ligase parkin n=1 Tax=Cotesia typhae TaxID=2053667 RepID=A0A8J5QNS4_9HYME|nr:hypothetical protein G9C98_005844 [Cotesia typhae]
MNFLLSIIRNAIIKMLELIWFGKRKITNSLSIYIKTNTGNTLTVDLDPKWDIKNVKEILAPQMGMPAEDIKIIFAGKELHNSTIIEECDLGQQSILHAVKAPRKNRKPLNTGITPSIEELDDDTGSKPMNETLSDLSLDEINDQSKSKPLNQEEKRAHFYIFCSVPCKSVEVGKLRVRCALCGSGAVTVDRDPQSWPDVMQPNRITVHCENDNCPTSDSDIQIPYAQFYFKCANHPKCFKEYCSIKLSERQFDFDQSTGYYTLACPAGCDNSYIREIHHFRLLKPAQYDQYQRFGAEEYVLRAGGLLCPQPDCGMGIIPPAPDENFTEEDCRKIQCVGGCGYVFCKKCLHGYHLGDCDTQQSITSSFQSRSGYSVDPARAKDAKWDDASTKTIQKSTKPCPKCRTPTERDGGCMHMFCTRAGCNFQWCWMCQTPWTRDCMGNHWFG